MSDDVNAEAFITADEEHKLIGEEAAIGCAMLIVCLFVGYLVERHKKAHWVLEYMNETNVAILLGALAGVLLRMIPNRVGSLGFEPEILYYVLLPPIIFEAGYSLQKRYFFENFGSILMLAVLGTFISTFTVAFIMFGLSKARVVRHLGTDRGIYDSLLFGAMISAVDPVSTLAVLNSHSCSVGDPMLPSIMFGESVLNDAVAIVLYRTFSQYRNERMFESGHATAAVGSFFLVFLGSTLVGVAVACAISLVFRRSSLHESAPDLEIALVALFATLCYLVAEATGLSGIVSLFFFGIVLSHYNWYNLSISSQVATAHGFKAGAHLAETFLYAYLGLSLSAGIDKWDPGMVLGSLFAIVVARACNIFPLCWLLNQFRSRRDRISLRYQIVLWYAGLRGAIAFGLSLDFPTASRPYVVSTTIFVVLFTTVVVGSGTAPLLRALRLDTTRGRGRGVADQGDPDSAHSESHDGTGEGGRAPWGAASGGGRRDGGGGRGSHAPPDDAYGDGDRLVAPIVRIISALDRSHFQRWFGGRSRARRGGDPAGFPSDAGARGVLAAPGQTTAAEGATTGDRGDDVAGRWLGGAGGGERDPGRSWARDEEREQYHTLVRAMQSALAGDGYRRRAPSPLGRAPSPTRFRGREGGGRPGALRFDAADDDDDAGERGGLLARRAVGYQAAAAAPPRPP
jgi:sodium/hydrogen exchanger 8